MMDAVHKNLPETRQYKNMLFDFYGALLTDKQKEIYQMHHEDDFSLAEIGSQMDVTSQAVADVLKRTDIKLNNYERKLELIKKFNIQKEASAQIEEELTKLEKKENISHHIKIIREAIDKLIM